MHHNLRQTTCLMLPCFLWHTLWNLFFPSKILSLYYWPNFYWGGVSRAENSSGLILSDLKLNQSGTNMICKYKNLTFLIFKDSGSRSEKTLTSRNARQATTANQTFCLKRRMSNSHNTLFKVFSIWVFFQKHSQFRGHRGNGEAIPLTPLYHFDPLYKHLDISQMTSPLHIANSGTRNGNLWFSSASR